MPLLSRSYEELYYKSDDDDIKIIRQAKRIRDLTASWNPEPTTTQATDFDNAYISKTNRQRGQRPRYFKYACILTSGDLVTTLYMKVAVLTKETFESPGSGFDSFAVSGIGTFNFMGQEAENNK